MSTDTPAVVWLPSGSDEAFHLALGFQLLLSVWVIYWSAGLKGCYLQPPGPPSSVRLGLIVKSDETVGPLEWQSDTLLVAEGLICFSVFLKRQWYVSVMFYQCFSLERGLFQELQEV